MAPPPPVFVCAATADSLPGAWPQCDRNDVSPEGAELGHTPGGDAEARADAALAVPFVRVPDSCWLPCQLPPFMLLVRLTLLLLMLPWPLEVVRATAIRCCGSFWWAVSASTVLADRADATAGTRQAKMSPDALLRPQVRSGGAAAEKFSTPRSDDAVGSWLE